MSNPAKVLYTANTRITGAGRDGIARSNDGRLDVQLAGPGSAAPGTNPEQLLGAGWGACYLGAVRIRAKEHQIVLPEESAVRVEVDLILAGPADYRLAARLFVELPGLPTDLANQLVTEAHAVCPYSKALHGSIDIKTTVAV